MLHIRWNLMTRGVQNCKNNSDWSPVTFTVSIRRFQEIFDLSEGGSNINLKTWDKDQNHSFSWEEKIFKWRISSGKKSIFSTTPSKKSQSKLFNQTAEHRGSISQNEWLNGLKLALLCRQVKVKPCPQIGSPFYDSFPRALTSKWKPGDFTQLPARKLRLRITSSVIRMFQSVFFRTDPSCIAGEEFGHQRQGLNRIE